MTVPRFATPRNPERPTTGGRVARVAAELGRPLHPYQQMIVDVAGEYDPDTGLAAYSDVVVVMPRRGGKTYTVLAVLLERLRRPRPDVRVFYTAQTATDAVRVMRDEWIPVISGSPTLRRCIVPRYALGDPGMFVQIGGRRYGRLEIFSPNANALHGRDADLVVVDETWAFDTVRGDEIDAGIRPARWARPGSQVWYVTAGGTEDSGWLHSKMDAGRAGAPGVAYFEWSADAEAPGYDPYDETLWSQVHPGIGSITSPELIRADAAMMRRRDFERALLCVWDRAAGTSLLAGWERLLDPTAKPAGELVLAFDVNPERSAASIAVAGAGVVEIVEHQDGVAWVGPRITELLAAHPDIGAVVRDPAGPAGATRLEDVHVVDLTADQVAEACAALVDAIAAGALRLRPHPALARAFGAARIVNRGDGRFVFARRSTEEDLSALYAATAAVWASARIAPSAIY